ncbi:coiled-coil domain-containing protein [Sesbania bispinosa]|nr:coiled-coil domain-containing protein [Sesbania bispinosa]
MHEARAGTHERCCSGSRGVSNSGWTRKARSAAPDSETKCATAPPQADDVSLGRLVPLNLTFFSGLTLWQSKPLKEFEWSNLSNISKVGVGTHRTVLFRGLEEIKMKKLRGELAAAEAEFEVARKGLSRVRKGFQEINVNAPRKEVL